mgnify:FL=1
MSSTTELLPATLAWLKRNEFVESAVLFGSAVRDQSKCDRRNYWSDLDLHVVATEPSALESVDWNSALPKKEFCLQVARPATGGVRKVTAVFASGQIDLVVVSSIALSKAAESLLPHDSLCSITFDVPLNEMATCLHSGYRFLKGKKKWGAFYARIAKFPGVRISDFELHRMGNIFVCDLLWVLQKLDRGEIVAAQHVIHGKLVDANLRLWRELQLRRGTLLPSF